MFDNFQFMLITHLRICSESYHGSHAYALCIGIGTLFGNPTCIHRALSNISTSRRISRLEMEVKISVISLNILFIESYILDASCSVDLRLLAISSVLAIIVYIVLMLASMQSVNLFTELL